MPDNKPPPPSSSVDRVVFRSYKPKRYTVMDHDGMLLDDRLTWQARGMLGYLLSKPPHWQTKIKDLVKRSPGGRDRVISICKELVKFRYMVKFRWNDEQGFIKWTTIVSETPLPEGFTLADWQKWYDDPKSENPTMVDPMMVKTNVGRSNDGQAGRLDSTEEEKGSSKKKVSSLSVDGVEQSSPGSDVASGTRPQTAAQIKLEIFTFWQRATGRTTTKLIPGSKRDRNLTARLKDGFTKWQIMCGVVGCCLTPHNMGENDNHKVYNDLELICRSVEILEGHIEMAFSRGWSAERVEQTETMSPEDAKRLHDALPTAELEPMTEAAEQPSEWLAVMECCRTKLQGDSFATWFGPLRGLAYDAEHNRVLVEAPNQVVRDWVKVNYANLLDQAFGESGLPGVTIEWKYPSEKKQQCKSKQSNDNQTSFLDSQTPVSTEMASNEKDARSATSD